MSCQLSPFLAPLASFIAFIFHWVWDMGSLSPCEGAQPRAPQDTPLAIWCRFGTDILTPTSWSSSTLLRLVQDYWGRERQHLSTLLRVWEASCSHFLSIFRFWGDLNQEKLTVDHCWHEQLHCLVQQLWQPRAEPGTSNCSTHFTRAVELDQAHWETALFGVLGVSFGLNHLSAHCSQLPACTRLFTDYLLHPSPVPSDGSQWKWETAWKYSEHWQALMGLLSCFKAILLTHYAAAEGNYFQGKWLTMTHNRLSNWRLNPHVTDIHKTLTEVWGFIRICSVISRATEDSLLGLQKQNRK